MPRLSRALLALVVLLLMTTMSPAQATVFDGQKDDHKIKAFKHVHKKKHRTVAAPRVMRTLAIARAQRGDPYRYGAAGPNAFDCSGLVYYAAHRAGLRGVPRTSRAQAGFVRRIPRAALRPGDLIFLTGSGGVYHVGFFVGRVAGRPMVLHSPYSGTRVRTERIWSSSWFAGTLRPR